MSQRETHAFRPDPVPDLILARLLQAARRAPAFGHLNPWSFILVRDPATRLRISSTIAGNAERPRGTSAGEEPPTKTVGEAPVSLCVTCGPLAAGPTRNGPRRLDSADVLSMCGAVQNFWLAARAEGLGVSWVDVRRPDVLRPILEIPPSILPIALLCVGYSAGSTEPRTAEKPQERVDLTDLVYVNRWGTRADAEPFFRHLDDQGLLL